MTSRGERLFGRAALLLVAGLLLASCKDKGGAAPAAGEGPGATPAAAETGPVVIGAYLSMTGSTATFGITTERTSQYLNWRFGLDPQRQYRTLAVQDAQGGHSGPVPEPADNDPVCPRERPFCRAELIGIDGNLDRAGHRRLQGGTWFGSTR